jgi:hypothetical protein
MWESIAEHIKTAGVALTLTVAGWGAYTTAGLPVPASIQLVDSRISAVNGSIRSLTEIVLDGQLEQHDLARSEMRIERSTLEGALNQATDQSAKITIRSRLDAIDDRLKVLDEKDVQIRARLNDMRNGPKV